MPEQLQTEYTTIPTRELHVGVDREETLVLAAPTENVEGKLDNEHKELIRRNWQILEDYAGGEGASSDALRAPVKTVLATLGDSKFERSMKLSFEKRLEARQRTEWLAELETTNSPWRDVIRLAKGTMYGDRSSAKDKFVDNYMAMSAMSIKSRIAQFVDGQGDNGQDNDLLKSLLEREITDLYTDYLSNVPEDEARNIKFKDILPAAVKTTYGAELTHDELLRKLNDKVLVKRLQEEAQTLSSDDILNWDEEFDDDESDFGDGLAEDFDFGDEEEGEFEFDDLGLTDDELKEFSIVGAGPSRMNRIKEGLANTYSDLQESLAKVKGKIKVSPQSFVNGVLDDIKSRKIEIRAPEINFNLSPKVKRGIALASVGASLVLGPMAKDAQQSQVENTSGSAGTPSNTLELPESPWKPGLVVPGQAHESVVGGHQASAPAAEGQTGVVEEVVEEQVPTEIAEAPEAAESAQETPGYTQVIEGLKDKGFEIEQREDGELVWIPESGQTVSHLLHIGFGYSQPQMWGTNDEEGVVDKYNLRDRRPVTGVEWPIPTVVIENSPLNQEVGEVDEAA